MLFAFPNQATATPLNLPYIVEQAIVSHPTMQSARLDSQASAQDVEAAQKQSWPTLSAIVESDTTTSRPATATTSQLLRLDQTLWDGGRNHARIDESQEAYEASLNRIYVQREALALQAVNAWQSLLVAHAKVDVAQHTLEKFEGYRAQMQRRIDAEVSPAIDLELVNSRSLQTEVELTNAQTGVRSALNKLEQLASIDGLGQYANQVPPMPDISAIEDIHTSFLQMNWTLAASRHPSVTKARLEKRIADYRIQAKRAEKWPQLYLRVDHSLDTGSNQDVAVVGLRYTPGAGFSSVSEERALLSRAQSSEQGIEVALRDVLESLYNDRDEFNNGRQRVNALQRAVAGTDRVLESYGRQFTAGRKTWQDLMNAVRELTQNQYALVEAKATTLGAMYRLQIRLGLDLTPFSEELVEK